MNNSKLKIILEAQDNVSKELKAMQKELKKVSSELSKMKNASSGAGRNVSNDLNKIKNNADGATSTIKKLVGTFQGLGALRLFGAIGALYAFRQALLLVRKAMITASEFEKAISDIGTLYQDAGESVAELEKGIKSLTKSIPVNANELGASAYQIVSAGISDTTEALKVLEQSGKLGVAGLSTTAEAADILTSAINAFKQEGLTADDIANTLFGTVKAGKTTIAQLAQSFGATAPTIAEAGVKLKDFQAATAALTTTGLPASQAQQSLRQAVAGLLKPTEQMKKLFETIGVKDGRELIKTSENLKEVFDKLKAASDFNNISLEEAVGSVEALTSVYGLNSSVAGNYLDTLNSLNNSSGTLTEAFLKQQDTMSAQWQLVKNQLNIAMIELGSVVFPIVLKATKALISTVESLVNFYREHADVINKVVIPAVFGLTTAFIALKTAIAIGGIIKSVTTAYALMVPTLVSLGTASGTATVAITGLRAAIMALGGPITIIIGLLSALALHAYNVVKEVNGMSKEVLKQNEKIQDQITRKEQEALDDQLAAQKAKTEEVIKLKNLEAEAAINAVKLAETQTVTTKGGFLNLFETTSVNLKYDGEARKELLAQRDAIVADIAKVKSDIEKSPEAQKELSILEGGIDIPDVKIPEIDTSAFKVLSEDADDATKALKKLREEAIKQKEAVYDSIQSTISVGEKLKDGLKALRDRYREVKKDGKDAVESLRKASRERLGEISDDIAGVRDELGNLLDDFRKAERSDRNGLAEQFVAAEENVKSLKEELARATDAQDILDIKGQIKAQEDALAKTAGVQKQFTAEISEARRRAGLTDLERAIEDYNAKRDIAQREYQDSKSQLEQQIADLKAQRSEEKELTKQAIADKRDETAQKLKEIEKEKKAFLKSIVEELQQQIEKSVAVKALFGSVAAYRESVAQRTGQVVRDTINDEIRAYQDLADEIRKVGSISSSAGKARNNRDTGGSIQQTGLYRLHQGETVLTKRDSQQNIGGGVSVYIQGGTYLSQDSAEKIGNLIIDKLKMQQRV